MTEVRVPTLGESVTEATVATWFKKPGDAVQADEMLCELETDKVTVEVPAPTAGTLGEIIAAEGETVGVDALLATINAGEAASPAPKAEAANVEAHAADAAVAPAAASSTDVEDAPSAKTSSWPRPTSTALLAPAPARDGRVMKDDVAPSAIAAPAETFAPAAPGAAAPPRAPVSVDDAAREERVKMTRSAPDHRPPPQRQPEHRRHAHHL